MYKNKKYLLGEFSSDDETTFGSFGPFVLFVFLGGKGGGLKVGVEKPLISWSFFSNDWYSSGNGGGGWNGGAS